MDDFYELRREHPWYLPPTIDDPEDTDDEEEISEQSTPSSLPSFFQTFITGIFGRESPRSSKKKNRSIDSVPQEQLINFLLSDPDLSNPQVQEVIYQNTPAHVEKLFTTLPTSTEIAQITSMTGKQIEEELLGLPMEHFLLQTHMDLYELDRGVIYLLFKGRWRLLARALRPFLAYLMGRFIGACLMTPLLNGLLVTVIAPKQADKNSEEKFNSPVHLLPSPSSLSSAPTTATASSSLVLDEYDELSEDELQNLFNDDENLIEDEALYTGNWERLHQRRLERMQQRLLQGGTNAFADKPKKTRKTKPVPNSEDSTNQKSNLISSLLLPLPSNFTNDLITNVRLLGHKFGFQGLFQALHLRWTSMLLSDCVNGIFMVNDCVVISKTTIHSMLLSFTFNVHSRGHGLLAACMKSLVKIPFDLAANQSIIEQINKSQISEKDNSASHIPLSSKPVPWWLWAWFAVERITGPLLIALLSSSRLYKACASISNDSSIHGDHIIMASSLVAKIIGSLCWSHFLESLPLLLTIPLHNMGMRLHGLWIKQHEKLPAVRDKFEQGDNHDSISTSLLSMLHESMTVFDEDSASSLYRGWRWHLAAKNYQLAVFHLNGYLDRTRHHSL